MAVGPVDVYIIGFPGNKFTGRIAPAIMELVDNGTIRVLDLLFVTKDADGVMTSLQAADLDEEGAGLRLDRRHAARCAGARGRRGGQRRPPGQQLGPPGRIRERLGRQAGRRPPGRGRLRDRLDPDPGRRRDRRARRRLDPPTSRSRGNDMGLLRMAARTAVVAGTATAVSGRVAVVRPPGTTSRTRSSTRRSRSSTQQPQRAGRRRRTTRPHSCRSWRRCTRRACSPMRSSQQPRPRSSESDRRPRPGEARRGVLAAGGGLRRDRHRPLPRPLGLIPP